MRAAVMAVSANADNSVLIFLSGLASPLATSWIGLRREAAKGENEGKSSCKVLLDVLLSWHQVSEWVYEWVSKRVSKCVYEWVNESVCEWVYEWVNECVWVYEWVNEWEWL